MQTGKEEAEMKFKRNVALKSGESCELRSLHIKDAREALAICKKAAEETRNLIRYADEWTMTEEEEAAFIKRQEDDPNALMLGAFLSGRLIGIASFAPRALVSRARHRAELGVMVLKSCWGKGVATAMIEALVEKIQDTPWRLWRRMSVPSGCMSALDSANLRAIRASSNTGTARMPI